MNSPHDLSDAIRDYDFALPEDLIAQDPAEERTSARLLVVRRDPRPGEPRFEDLLVSDLPRLAASEPKLQNALWLRNVSRVIPARFYARRPSGGRHEIVLLEEREPGLWTAIIRNSASMKFPQALTPEGENEAVFYATEPGLVDFRAWREPVREFLERRGEMPLPPYIRKRVQARDRDRYQPVWARPEESASVAAPTASLHFNQDLIAQMERAGGSFAELVLHVGLGTFEPVRTDKLSDHALHEERIQVTAASRREITQALDARRPVVPIGTTAMRTLESLSLRGEVARAGTQIQEIADGSLKGRTALFVRPGFEFRYASALLTNFHLPQSTLLVLVSTFAGSRTLALEAYRHAVSKGYRFFSFGDASIWI